MAVKRIPWKEKRIYRKENKALFYLYHTIAGRLVLRVVASRTVSRICGAFFDSALSKPMIPLFIRKHDIDMADYMQTKFSCFNAFFTRQIKPELRPISDDPEDLVSPCDGLLSAYHISDGTILPIKHSTYTISHLLGDDPIAQKYDDGVCLVFRLCVDNYHRYCYFDSGRKGENVFLSGMLHTVRPVALARYPVFVRNCREYTVMETENFGTVTQVEVGAMLVGEIENFQSTGSFVRGQEKGLFRYGGSTVVLLFEKGRVKIPDEIFEDTAQNMENAVQMGQVIGQRTF